MKEKKQSQFETKQSSARPGKKVYDILKWLAVALTGLAAVVLIFSAGMFVGGMKAKFSYGWAESYHKNFAGPQNGFLDDWRSMPPLPGDFIESHGVFGEIIELGDKELVVKGRGNTEKIVVINKDTVIKKGGETITGELKIGDNVVIIGSPNEEGQIEAKLIRVFDKEAENSPMPNKAPRFPFF